MISAIVLAAGESKRMGKANKLFLEYQGTTILQKVLDEVLASTVEEVILVLSPENKLEWTNFTHPKLHIVENPDYRKGMTTTIQKGVAASLDSSKGYMICLADQVLIPTNVYNTLIEAFKLQYLKNKHCILAPFFEEKKGNPILFSHTYKNEILNHQEMEGCKAIVQSNKQHLMKIPFKQDAILRDMDTPEDYQRLFIE